MTTAEDWKAAYEDVLDKAARLDTGWEGIARRYAEEIERLRAERGDYVLALEQIRSAPLAKESSIQRYKRCRDTASDVLNKHAQTA